jgi:hypothetical protein
MHTEPLCSHCGKQLSVLHLSTEGEFYCKEHCGFGAIALNESESSQMLLLAKSRSLLEIINQQVEARLSGIINHLFEQVLQA